MVHAAHAHGAVPDAGRDARAQHGDQDHVLVGDKVFAGQHLDGVVLEMRVVIEERSLARDRKSTRLNSSHLVISYAVFCLKKKKKWRRFIWPRLQMMNWML